MQTLAGRIIGRLTVVSPGAKVGNRSTWECLCSCGNTVVVLQQSLLKRSPTKSCGCIMGEALTKDLAGLKFGDWVVQSKSEKKKKPNGGCYWLCTCVCGTIREVSSETLLNEKSTNCGCSRSRPICPKGHLISEWGRDKTGMCRACIKNRNFIRNYGITLADYIAIWEYQQGKCAVCGDPVSIQLGRPGYSSGCRAELDHEHNKQLPQKQQVRGILCGGRWSGCNRKLGRLDSFEWLSAAARYIQNPPARQFFAEKKSVSHTNIK